MTRRLLFRLSYVRLWMVFSFIHSFIHSFVYLFCYISCNRAVNGGYITKPVTPSRLLSLHARQSPNYTWLTSGKKEEGGKEKEETNGALFNIYIYNVHDTRSQKRKWKWIKLKEGGWGWATSHSFINIISLRM